MTEAITREQQHTASLFAGNIQTFLEIKRAYDECDKEIQGVIDDMVAIYASDDATCEQKRRAMHTILEAIFPSLCVDVLDGLSATRQHPEAIKYEHKLNKQEETFAERLKSIMQEKGCTQEDLAERTGVGQPAISNMINRTSRPQTRTVRRIAEAIGVPIEDLWPKIADKNEDENREQE